MTTCCTRASPALARASASATYGRLCNTTRDLILLHRKQLRGRFHLLLPLLQALLAALFTPESIRSKAASSRPQWLDPTTDVLTSEHALLYSRVLETLCSPSVSSVTSGQHQGKRASTALTDETKAARKYAGQYVAGVISQFCSSQLSGRMAPEMRRAVLPGIYACIDVVEMDALRAMNAGMDSGMRTIWKGLYAEWKRSTERV
jgi:nucleolar pre-ribosomal-associated protein 2